MRRTHLFCLLVGMVIAGNALAGAIEITVKSVGFGGYYRADRLTPIVVQLDNPDELVKGELMVTYGTDKVAGDTFRFPLTVPAGAKQLKTLYVLPPRFDQQVTVQFIGKGQPITATFNQCQEIYTDDRLLVVVGGTGSAFGYANGQAITVSQAESYPPAWNSSAYQEWQGRNSSSMRFYPHPSHSPGYVRRHGPGPMSVPPPSSGPASGAIVLAPIQAHVRVAYVDASLLPDNPAAYESVSHLALMSDVSENSLKSAQDAITQWVYAGGHLLVASGGSSARLQSPFFTTLLPEQGGKLIDEAKLISGSNGKTATTAPIGQGRVSLLHYDPDVAASGDWKQDLQFLGTLMADEPPLPLALALDGDTQTAMMIQNMRPVNFTVMYIFLFVYLVLLVPVNYLVLKKLDKRELAWATTIAIVFLFTCGAYLIGGFSKGFSMIVNTVSLVEASPGQRIATAVSKALIFSPAQRSYQVKFGETNQVAKEIVTAGGDSYSPWRQNINKETPLTYIAGENGNEVDNLPISMWASRSFAMTHRYDLGGGITSALAYDKTTNRLSGTLTNNTPYTFNNCAMDYSDSDHAIFALRPGETLTIAQAIAEANPQMPKEDSTLVEAIHSEVTKRYGTFNMSSGTVTLVACTDDLHAGVPIKVNGHTSTRSLTVFVMHLPVK